MTNEDYALQPGTVLQDKYRIEAVLGKGGFGITYRARHIGLQKEVAIKEFFMRGACERQAGTTHVTTTQSNREMADRFRHKFVKEAQLIASLSHPGIVRVSDIFETNGTAYYVMDYVEGENLNERVKRLGHLSEAEALTYIRQVGDALCYVHAKHMLHLDVKPANILLEQESGRAVLIDFGVAKQYDTAGEQTSSTPAAVSNGYSPIEQYGQGTGVTAFTPATDVYALAATFYKLLTGITPPPSAELLAGEKELAPYPDEVSQTSREAIGKALQMRKARPQSVEEFLRLLNSLATKENTNNDTTLLQVQDDTTLLQKEEKGNTNFNNIQKPKSKIKYPIIITSILIAILCISIGIIINREQKTTPPTTTNINENAKDSLPANTRTHGTKVFENEYKYEGELLNDLPDGQGIAHYYNGNSYEGEWKDGKQNGTGTFLWSNGDKYVGEWKNGEPNGEGIYHWKEGTQYDGKWLNGNKHGKGTMTYSDGSKYIGEWQGDRMHGQGTLLVSDGSKYVGEFKNGNINGQGTYTTAQGTKYTGQWKDGMKNGYGTVYNAEGKIVSKGQWKNDEPIEETQIYPE